MHGKGAYFFSDGDVFEGSIEHGKFVTGVYKYVNGQVYEGEIIIKSESDCLGFFHDNQPNGHGEVRYPNGDIYTGEWKDGKRQV